MSQPVDGAVTETVGRLIGSEPAALADPYPLYAELRGAGRCFWAASDWGSGGWHLMHHADVAPALRDLRLSSSGVIRPLEDAREPEDELTRQFWSVVEGSLLTADPPDHTRLRKLVSPAFTPKRIQALKPQLQVIVNDLLRAAEAKGEFDFIANFANPLPLMAIATLMGVPKGDWPLFRRLSDGLFDLQPSPESMQDLQELMAYLDDIAEKRRTEPQDDLISALVHAQGETDGLTGDELRVHLVTILTGGYDTTSAGLGNSLLTLLQRPKAWAKLGELDSVAQASEELLRFESPFQYGIRRATEDLELGGEQVKAGDLVWLWLGSANRDPAIFSSPNDLDLSREGNKHVAHLAFGMGVHYCLGAPLVRLEMQLALTTLRKRLPNLHLTQDAVNWRSGSVVRSLETLPVALS